MDIFCTEKTWCNWQKWLRYLESAPPKLVEINYYLVCKGKKFEFVDQCNDQLKTNYATQKKKTCEEGGVGSVSPFHPLPNKGLNRLKKYLNWFPLRLFIFKGIKKAKKSQQWKLFLSWLRHIWQKLRRYCDLFGTVCDFKNIWPKERTMTVFN